MAEANTQATQNQDPQQAPAVQTQATQAQGQQAPVIDYTKIQQMLEGTLAAKEDTALKAYFKQQGLSQEEMDQAIAAFKQQKAAQQPDVGAIQQQLTQAQAIAQQAQLQSAATMAAVSLGIDAKTIPYILKMADLGQVMGQDGNINDESLKNAINKVLEDVPALKPQAAGATGFIQVGAASAGQQITNEPMTLKDAISEALKK
ncbi:hypothetical protein [Hungatella effluvii]|uniref:hypothetical protein n=1 Tax=Hungatella effluvii TaxID=1096246 RepID=UPI002A81FF9B|nr:hypothetical protein [Hungatella effluvii]